MAGEAITLENLRQLLGIQTELREAVDVKWRQAQRVLVSLLETFAPEEADRRLKNGQPLDSLPIEELEQLLRHHIAARLNHAVSGVERESRVTSQANLEKMQKEISDLHQENQQLSTRLEQLIVENGNLRSQLAALQQANAHRQAIVDPSKPTRAGSDGLPSSLPDQPYWLVQWRKAETFERDASILSLIAESGLARRPVIEVRTAEILGIKKAGGSIQALLARLVDLGLIEIDRPWNSEGAGSGGRLPDLLRLTERGVMAYWFLTGKQAPKNEFDRLLERHVTPEHTLLNLQAADMLREAGYQVELTPTDIRLPDGGILKPDLVLTDENGMTLFVEVEREANKDREQRQAKWRNLYQASGGQLYIVCDNRACMRNVRSEINYFLSNQPATIYLTNLADLLSGKRGSGDSIWLEVRKR